MTELLRQSSETFSVISNHMIESMRNTALIDVGFNLMESCRRSILRAAMEDANFNRNELEILYKWFEVGNVGGWVGLCGLVGWK